MGITAVSKRLTAVVAALGLAAAACSHTSKVAQRTAATVSTSTTTTTEVATTTTETPTTRKPAPPLPGLGVGARGPEVQALEEKLAAMHYDVGKVDGYFDGMTSNAVIAFQKWEGLSRTGRATDDVIARLQTATAPAAMVPGGGATHVEVDIKRQILLLFVNSSLYRVLPVSTGSGQKYCVDGDCATAVTPGGSFRVTWRVSGWHTSRLGKLYNPLFFNGGIAIHGALSVPAYPASHGCVRIPMSAAEWFPKFVPRDTPVYVLNGVIAPVPFDEPAPNGAPPSSVATTSTSSTTSTTQPGWPFSTTTSSSTTTSTTRP